jgi:uncharacterized protein
MNPANTILQSQLKALEAIILGNHVLRIILNKLSDASLPNWYIGAGCIAQTVWNHFSALDPLSGINDIDIVYFDPSDLTSETEARKAEEVRRLFSGIPIAIDVKNQARVHLWYESHFGYPIQAYSSVEEAINDWPTTATAIGVRVDDQGSFDVYAPYGLNDLFGLMVRPNKAQITEEIYLAKARRWQACWPSLTIVPWETGSTTDPNRLKRKSELQPELFHDFVKLIEKLKATTRHSWSSDGRQESVAEHSWRLSVMALLLGDVFPGVDMAKILTMCLLHDLGEIQNGDIPAFDKSEGDHSDEAQAIAEISRSFPSIAAVCETILEFTRNETLEARLVNALDKLEAVSQHNQAPLETWLEKEYTLNLTYGEEESSQFPFLQELRHIVRKDTERKISEGRN